MVKMYRDHYVNLPMAEVLGRTFMIFLSPLIATFVNCLWRKKKYIYISYTFFCLFVLQFYIYAEIHFESLLCKKLLLKNI